MDEERTGTKRPYTTPTLTRVVLNAEQAVLSQCSLNFNSLQDSVLAYCDGSGSFRCRKKTDSFQADFNAWS